jgi:hypothetical protein
MVKPRARPAGLSHLRLGRRPKKGTRTGPPACRLVNLIVPVTVLPAMSIPPAAVMVMVMVMVVIAVVVAVVVAKTPQAAGENITDYHQNPP